MNATNAVNTNEFLLRRLEKPKGKIDVVIDTDTFNEVDDQFALAYLIRSSDKLNLKAIYAAPLPTRRPPPRPRGWKKTFRKSPTF